MWKDQTPFFCSLLPVPHKTSRFAQTRETSGPFAEQPLLLALLPEAQELPQLRPGVPGAPGPGRTEIEQETSGG